MIARNVVPYAVTAMPAMLLVASAAIAQTPAPSSSVEILPLNLNTNSHEYAPTITADGRTLFFTSDRQGGEGGHDHWNAVRIGDSYAIFDGLLNAGPPLNTALNDGVASISADGRTIYFTACQRDDGLGDCDIYAADRVGAGFDNVRNITTVNSWYWDTQPSISADGATLFFVSNRPGALGGDGDTDIWKSTLQADGTWSAPINLGAPVNTPLRQDSPFLHPSGKFLYYSTRGNGGYGGLDFVVSQKTADGWSAPVNLGNAINTDRDERFISVPTSGDAVYFSSERLGVADVGGLNLFVATGLVLPSAIRAELAMSGALALTPNPARSRVTVTLSGHIATTDSEHQLTIVDDVGRVVLTQTFSGDSATLDVSALANGAYIVRIGNLNGRLVVSR